MEKIRAISREIIEEKGGLVEDRIMDAMKKYPNRMLEKSAAGYVELLERLMELNGEGNCFADLYFGRLAPEEQQRILTVLSDEEKLVLQAHCTDEGIYFPLTKANLPLLAALSAREILFSTYYFTKYPCTVWGNYELKYPVFFGTEECVKLLEKMIQ